MANGLIGSADLAAGIETSLGTLTENMIVNVLLCNRTANDAKIRIAFSASAIAPTAQDYIDYENTLSARKPRERGGIAASNGETIWVRSDILGVSARAHGVPSK